MKGSVFDKLERQMSEIATSSILTLRAFDLV